MEVIQPGVAERSSGRLPARRGGSQQDASHALLPSVTSERQQQEVPIGAPSCGRCDGSFPGSVRPLTPKGHRKHRLP
jgi:hypothetical protein